MSPLKKERLKQSLDNWLTRTDTFVLIKPTYQADVESMLTPCLIPDDDPRVGLRKQQGLKAIKPIANNTPVGIYVGRVYTSANAEQDGNKGRVARYLYDLIFTLAGTKYDLVIDGNFNNSKNGNWTALINANTVHQPEIPSMPANIHPLQVFYKGVPLIVFVACKNIEPQEELLYDYGIEYWRTQHKKTGNEDNPIIID